MSEWWTYRLSDFLLFSPRTYYRLFELYNAELWPLHGLALGVGLALLVLAARQRSVWTVRAACALLAACWLWVAWAFHLQRFASINWAATWFAGAFAAEGLLLLLGVVLPRQQFGRAGKPRALIGWGLLVFALTVQPWVGVPWGRPLSQAEVFGLAPDPTALATLGLLLLHGPAIAAGPGIMWLAWPIPVGWCLISGATLWSMHAADAWVMPLGAALAMLAAARRHAAPEPDHVQGNTRHAEPP